MRRLKKLLREEIQSALLSDAFMALFVKHYLDTPIPPVLLTPCIGIFSKEEKK